MITIITIIQYIISPVSFGNFLYSPSNAVFYNPSMIDKNFHFSTIYGELYTIPGLNFFSISFSFNRVSWGVQVVNEGDFYLSSVNLGSSFSVDDDLKIGISGELKQLFKLNQPGVNDGFSLGAGFLIPYKNTINIGIALHNVFVTDKTLFDKGEIALSSRTKISPVIIMYFDALYDPVSKVSYRFLLNYKILKNFNIMAGFRSIPASYYIGLAFRDLVKFSYFSSLHTYLGLSHFVELHY